MKILLIYFTGTYNTRYLTSLLQERFLSIGDKVDILEVKEGSEITDLDYDLIGLGYPIYAFNAPNYFNKFIKGVEFKKDQKVFIYKQSGEVFKLNDASSRKIKKYLKKKKAILINEKHYVLPYNIHFRFEDKFIEEILYYDERLLDIFFYELEKQIISIIKPHFFATLTSLLLSIQKLGGCLNGPLYKVDKNKCINCGKCISDCPVNNISRKKGKIVFSNHCLMCMRCSFYCPSDAIKIGILNGWKVNGKYELSKYKKEKNDYLKEHDTFFYSCYEPYFKKIEEIYNNYF